MYWFLKYNYELRANDEEKIYVITPISISTEDIAVVYNGVRSGCLLTKSCTIYNWRSETSSFLYVLLHMPTFQTSTCVPFVLYHPSQYNWLEYLFSRQSQLKRLGRERFDSRPWKFENRLNAQTCRLDL